MSLQFWGALLENLKACENDPKIKGIIYRSGLKRDVFTAGNDIKELYAPMTTKERHRKFWLNQVNFLAKLYKSPLVTIAAIRGACPAGGCAVALCCDHRIMADLKKSKIGLNEVAIGLGPPPLHWGKVMMRLVGFGVGEKLLTNGIMLTHQQALKIGVIDEVVPVSDLDSAALKAIQKLLRIPTSSRIQAKMRYRKDLGDEWEANAEKEAAFLW
eukprot:CAMPEP_0197520912 /NCGR_PEP_ID=MMETSP1318-20131121/6236_1 /TAXON_ID=552666 /ORGANISM="Partenskyella glossopodia, Strain RCC365" /LENGTH=213 /DNA_ID=CAMNT_0043072683 /DNA_START=116 /DNA_END=754 /DNA_ORIENTATION=-